MSSVTVAHNALIEKDTNENRVILFDWDAENLATGASIATSTWTISMDRPSTETPVGLANDNATIVSGNRKTQTRLTGGTLGSLYRVTNTVLTDESPAQTKERSVFVKVVNL